MPRMKQPTLLLLLSLACCQAIPPVGAPKPFAPPFSRAAFDHVNAQGYLVYRRSIDGMPMVLVPAGDFTLYGQGESTCYLPPYLMDEHPVTNEQFRKFLKSWPLSGPDPAVGVTEEQARAYARWAGADLPSLAHFEKAAWGAARQKPERPVDKFGIAGLFGSVAQICFEDYKAPKSNCLVMGGSDAIPGTPSYSADDIGTKQVGFRCIIERPVPTTYPVEWRRDWWAALDESKRRNAIVFATFHWDG